MKKTTIAASLAATLIQFSPPALANSAINISTSHAEGRTGSIPTLTVWQPEFDVRNESKNSNLSENILN